MKLRSILILLLVMSAVLAAGAYQAIKWAQGPVIPPDQHPPSKDVVIPDGATFKHIAALLEREGLIKSQFAFVLIGRYQSADRKIQAGEYELSPSMTPAEILSKLTSGQVVLRPITIPEGLTMMQTADLMAQQGVVERDELLRLMKDRVVTASLGIKADNLEGYLYPDTYKFPKSVSAKEVVATMGIS